MFANHWYYRVVLIIGLFVPGPVFSTVATAQNYLDDARVLFDKGEYDAAVIQLKNVLLLEPDNAGAHLLLGNTFLESGDAASAEKELSRARDLGVDAADWMVPLGRAYLLLGRNDELLQAIIPEERFADAMRADILQLQGQAWLAKRQFSEADDKFLAALVLQPERSEAFLGRARVAYQKQEREQALEFIEEALRSDPRSADAWMMQGSLLGNAGDQKGAISAYRQALAIDPKMNTARAAMATAYIALGEYGAAMEEIEILRGQYPNSYLIYYLDALVQFQKQDMNRALTSVHDALRLAPRHLPSHFLAGSIYYRKGQYRQAVEYLHPYWDAHPGHPRSAKLLAISLVKTDQQQEAIEVLEKSVEFEPDDAQMLALLGSLYSRTGQETRGLEYLEKAVVVAPESAAIQTELAIGHLVTGDTGKAMIELQGAVELGDDLIQTDTLLVLMYIKQGKYEQAVTAAQQFGEKHPDISSPQNLLGNAYLAQRNYKAARAAYEKALLLEPNSVPPQLQLAGIDLLEKDRASAERRYRTVLEQDKGNLMALLELAKLAVEEGRTEEAKQLLLQAHASHPDAIKPALLLVELYRQAQDTSRALELARSVSTAHPRNPAVLRVLVRAQIDASELDEAMTSLRTLAEVTPSPAQVHYQIALLYLRQKNRAATRESLERALELQPDYPAVQLALGRVEILEKDFSAAQVIAAALQQAHPQAAYGQELEGDILAALGNYKQAALTYENAYKLKPSARLAIGLFNTSRFTGKADKAIATLRDWLTHHPGDTTIRMALASYLQQQGRLDAAVEEYLAILGHDPDNLTALNNVAWLYQQLGSDKGIAYAEHAYELVPQRAEVIDTLGWLLLQNGAQQRGLVLLQEALTKAPHNAEIRYHMAVALAAVGRREEARRELEWILENEKEFSQADEARELLDQLKKY